MIGAGVAGLACAWRLRHGGVEAEVLDGAREPGGNARGGKNEVSAYPWGAHYLRAPTVEHRSLERFLDEAGVIRGRDAQGRIDWDTGAVCAAPLERLYEGGLWTEGLLPRGSDAEEVRRFEQLVERLGSTRGGDGRPAFCIPLALASQDPELLELDGISLAAWFEREGFRCPGLRWYLDYACRDDYGCTIETTSAWAGLHYFAARAGGGEDRDVILTWPEGNARLVKRLQELAQVSVRTGNLCYRLPSGQEAWVVDAGGASVRWRAEQVVFAGPRFVLGRLLPEPPPGLSEFTYAPWLVANLTLDEAPTGVGAVRAWDNVFRESSSLGYVVANRWARGPQVVTWYQPLVGDPLTERRALLAMDHGAITERVLADVLAAHPSLAGRVRSVDAWRWGHAMVRPVPGFLWGETRRAAADLSGPVIQAHCDQSGISIFEEAFYRGVAAGEEVLRRRGATFESFL